MTSDDPASTGAPISTVSAGGWHNYRDLHEERMKHNGQMVRTVAAIQKHFRWLAIFSNSRWGVAYDRIERTFNSLGLFEADPDTVGTARAEKTRLLVKHLNEYTELTNHAGVKSSDVALLLGVRIQLRRDRAIAEATDAAIAASQTKLTEQQGPEASRHIQPMDVQPFSVKKMFRCLVS